MQDKAQRFGLMALVRRSNGAKKKVQNNSSTTGPKCFNPPVGYHKLGESNKEGHT